MRLTASAPSYGLDFENRRPMHESFKREEKIAGSSDRAFGLVFASFFAILAIIKLFFGAAHWAAAWAAGAVVFLIVALTLPRLLAPFNRVWMKIGLLLHRITNPIVLGLMFFGVFTPFGVIMRLFGWDGLARKLDPNADSYWVERESPGPPPDTMRQQF
jgi:hypothetical protein